jgi:hypothetical protein
VNPADGPPADGPTPADDEPRADAAVPAFGPASVDGAAPAGGAAPGAGDPTLEDARAWFTRRVPGDWFVGPIDVQGDRDELLVIGPLADPDVAALVTSSPAAHAAARVACITAFREHTRDGRVALAREAEHRYGRKVAWGARCGDREELFTNLSVPVMTRLRLPERAVLDVLIEAGVARSRSEALAWCVRLVGQHEGDWLAELRQALAQVAAVRRRGPRS